MIAYLIIKNHSERVPEKNFRELGGTPLFRWILETLQEVVEFERIELEQAWETVYRESEGFIGGEGPRNHRDTGCERQC